MLSAIKNSEKFLNTKNKGLALIFYMLIKNYLPTKIFRSLETARNFFDGDETRLRASLARFLFYGENVFKRVGTLSGGEKVRLKLFELIQKKANLLILDEPTNHIDIDTKEVLEEALSEYQGTLFFISHDRYFINRLAERIVNIEDKNLVQYLGNYDFYKECKQKKVTSPDVKISGRKR